MERAIQGYEKVAESSSKAEKSLKESEAGAVASRLGA
jgi:hypothetical protein